jgi:hypothetical protein
VTSAPVLFACDSGGFPLESWSGREDSNLRPLPPEGVAPRYRLIANGIFPWEQNSTGKGTLMHRSASEVQDEPQPLSKWLSEDKPFAAGDAVKIGRTKNFETRLRFIRGHNHEKVECLALLKGQGWREKELHKRFRAVRLRGEWFARCEQIAAEIERLKA